MAVREPAALISQTHCASRSEAHQSSRQSPSADATAATELSRARSGDYITIHHDCRRVEGGAGGAKVFKMCGFSSVDLSRDGEVALGLCVEGDFCSLVAGISAVTLVMDLLAWAVHGSHL